MDNTNGFVYLSGYTSSTSGIATSGTHQTSDAGGQDAFIAQFNTSGTIQWGTYYGGTGTEYNAGVAVDASGNVYLAGNTTSSSGIASGSGVFQSSIAGNTNIFLAQFNSSGTWQWGTYLGAGGTSTASFPSNNSSNGGAGIAVSGSNIYIAGRVNANGLGTTGTYQSTYNGSFDAFLTSFNNTGNINWFTYYGNGSGTTTYGTSCAVDGQGGIYLAGMTSATSSTLATADAFQSTNSGLYDGFVAKFDSTGARKWGTFFGGSDSDIIYSCAADQAGYLYIAGMSKSTSGIATSGAAQTSNGGSEDGFVAKFSDPVIATGTVSATGCTGATLSVPYTVVGAANIGNVFTAQLSSATGSFASPVNIGTNTSITSGTITATIPGGTTAGTGYRVRVYGSNPIDTGTKNTIDISIASSSASTVTSVSPVGQQYISSGGTSGLPLTVTEGSTVASRVWQYASSPGGTYTSISGQTATTFTPNSTLFSSVGTYYVVDVSTYPCATVTSNIDTIIITTPSTSNFYNKAPTTGNINLANQVNWFENTDGTGTACTSFSPTGRLYHISNTSNTTVGTPAICCVGWVIPSGSAIAVDNGYDYATNATISISGTINVGAGRTLTLRDTTTASYGPKLGTLASTATVVYAANVNTTPTATTTFPNLTISANTSLGGNAIVTGTLNIANGVTLNVGANTLTIQGTLSGTGQINATTGTVVINGVAGQTLSAGLFSGSINNLTINNAAGVTIADATTIASNLTLTNGVLTVTGGLTINAGGTVNIAGGALASNPVYGAGVNITTSVTGTSGNELTPLSGSIGTLNVSSGTYTMATDASPSIVNLSGGSLAVGNHNLTISGFSGSVGNSLKVGSGSTITVASTAANPTIYFDASNDTLGNLVANGSVTIGNTVNMAAASGLVSIGSSGALNANGNLTLLSAAGGTARIGAITSGGALTGNVNIQRYIPAQRGYRLISHPYTAGNEPTIATLGNYFDVTGIAGGNIGPGTTHCTNTTPSTYRYTPGTSPGYVGITSSATVIPAAHSGGGTANGILAFIRGGTGGAGCTGTTSYAVTPATFSTSGPINQGDVTETVPVGWNLVSNPYPSQVLLSSVDGISSLNAMVVVQPGQQNGGNGYTNGTAYFTADNTYVIPINGAFLANNTSGSDVTLTFHESSKTSGSPTTGILKTTNTYPDLELSIFNNNVLWDKWKMTLKPGASPKSGDDGDLDKISNTQLTFNSISANNMAMAWDARDADSIADGDVIPLNITSIQASYILQVSDYSLPVDKTVYLHDKYVNSYALVKNGFNYPFTVSGDTASQGINRMALVFMNNNSSGVSNLNNHTDDITIIPNPATNNIKISFGNNLKDEKNICILNVVGQVVSAAKTKEQVITLPISDLANGLYIVKTFVSGKTIIDRFVKN